MGDPNAHFLEGPHTSALNPCQISRKTFANVMNLLKNVSTLPRYFPMAVNPAKAAVFRAVIDTIK